MEAPTPDVVPANPQLLAGVVTHLPLGLLIYSIEDPDDPTSLRVLYLNEFGADFLRVPREEIVGRLARETAPDAVDNPLSRALAEVAIKGREADLGEIYYESPRVEAGYYRIRAFPVGPNTAAALFEGVTEQREMRDQLEHQALRFRAIFNATFQFIGLLRPDGTLLEINQTALEFAGLAEGEVVGKPFWECHWWTHSPTVQRQLQSAVKKAANGEFVRYNVQIRGKKDSRAVIDFSLKPVEDRGRVVLLIPEGRVITDLVRAQRAVKRLQKRMERILNAAGEGILSIDPDGIIGFANDAAASLLGPVPGDLTGRHHSDILKYVDEDGEPSEDSPIERVLRLERTRRTGRAYIVRQDSRSFPAEYIVTPLREGSETGAVVVFRDISERIEAERALRESEERHRTVLTTLEEGVVLLDGDGRVVMANPAARRFFDLRDGRDVNFFHTEHAFVREDGSQYAIEDLPEYEALTTGQAQHGVIKGWPTPNGGTRWYSVNAQPVLGPGGEISGVVASFDEITEQLEAERELRKSEARLQLAQQIAHLGGWSWDVHSDVISWSDELYRIYGLDRDSFEPSFDAFLERLHPEDREKTRRTIEQSLQSGAPYEITHRIIRPDGEMRVLLGRGEVITDDAGQVVAMQGTGQDITEQQRARDALQRYARELEERNAELEQFAYVASHDLQEPLRMISSFLQLLERRYADQLDDTAEEYIRFAVEGAKRMQRLIQDLLAYSRVGTRGKAFQRVDLNGLVQEVLSDLKQAVEEADGTVNVGELPTIQADPTQMRQLLQNLIGNALKFRSERAPEIRVSAERTLEDARPAWQIAVEDNGIGIAPEHRERIFQIFQRLHTREEYEGTGIGLAICRKIVERHSGRIWVESAPERGTTFYFTIPARPPRQGGDADDSQ